MSKLLCLSFLSLALAACAPSEPSEPCAALCMSSLVEYEPGYTPLPQP